MSRCRRNAHREDKDTSGFSPKPSWRGCSPPEQVTPRSWPWGFSQAARQVEKQEKGSNLAQTLGLLGKHVPTIPVPGTCHIWEGGALGRPGCAHWEQWVDSLHGPHWVSTTDLSCLLLNPWGPCPSQWGQTHHTPFLPGAPHYGLSFFSSQETHICLHVCNYHLAKTTERWHHSLPCQNARHRKEHLNLAVLWLFKLKAQKHLESADSMCPPCALAIADCPLPENSLRAPVCWSHPCLHPCPAKAVQWLPDLPHSWVSVRCLMLAVKWTETGRNRVRTTSTSQQRYLV